jgi:hypothetical protein
MGCINSKDNTNENDNKRKVDAKNLTINAVNNDNSSAVSNPMRTSFQSTDSSINFASKNINPMSVRRKNSVINNLNSDNNNNNKTVAEILQEKDSTMSAVYAPNSVLKPSTNPLTFGSRVNSHTQSKARVNNETSNSHNNNNDDLDDNENDEEDDDSHAYINKSNTIPFANSSSSHTNDDEGDYDDALEEERLSFRGTIEKRMSMPGAPKTTPTTTTPATPQPPKPPH